MQSSRLLFPLASTKTKTQEVQDLERFAASVIRKSGQVVYLINNALPLMKGMDDYTWEEFSCALAAGVTAPFYLRKGR